MPYFAHLHVHTQYSILDGAASIPKLISKTKEYGMDAIAITDHGNMYGVLKFVKEAKSEGIKPIIGCEIYVARNSRFDKRNKEDRSGYHLILLAKNLKGYHNLAKLSSLGYNRNHFYYTPRIDKELLREYSEGLIASSACLGGELPSAIMNHGKEKAIEVINEHKDIFGDDYYLEIQNSGQPEQAAVNKVIIELSAETGVKLIATNDVHFVNKEDFEAHRILICLNTGKDIDDKTSMHYTGEEYFKTPEIMAESFKEVPEAIENTKEIVDKIEDYDITTKNVILPHFPIPNEFSSEDDYLRHLTYIGAKKLYIEISEDIQERLDYELKIIKEMGFPGYFLIVQDLIAEARKMDVIVGPGRGSAAGSAVAYCTGITNIDPIKYNLLFERFLNPERVSMPDIDIDFDDEGREKVLSYVINKYGEEKVAQIVTFGTMAARLAIRDVARVLKLPLAEADRIAKLVPEKPGTTLKSAFKDVRELNEIRKNGEPLQIKTLKFAETLEGSARHTGTHACGVIIGPDNLIEYLPLSTTKDSQLTVTQYEGKLVETVGMLKMDFLGLKTLSIIKDAITNIYDRHGIKIEVENIPLEDEATFKLYQRGDTVGTFQFESEGMRNHLKVLKPTNMEDLIAMNALYRPGPMSFIPKYIDRKHGREKVEYPHPWLEDILKPTFGIMVYQEQIMQTAQKLGGYTLGGADLLRRAMGKKDKDIMRKQKLVFVEGAKDKGIDEEKATEVFEVMERFAEYGFNRSHSAAYSVIAYHTAYLKAHYPAEYMASVLTHNLNDIKKITFFIDESQKCNIPVLGPHLNESNLFFKVNDKGEVRFGMAAIKGVGENAVNAIIEERKKNGIFKDVFDFAKRINLRAVNKRSFEALAKAGAFDSFKNVHRAQYFFRENTDDSIFLEKIIKHAGKFQEKKNSSQVSLFGDDEDMNISDILMPECEPWSKMQQLKNEKEVTGFYISGHPLDDYQIEIKNFCTHSIDYLNQDLKRLRSKAITFAGMLTSSNIRTTKSGNEFALFTVEDFTDSINLSLFSEAYLKLKHLLVEGSFLLIKAQVQPRYNNPDIMDVKISSMSLLAESIKSYTREMTIFVKSENIDPELVQKLKKLIQNNSGKCPLKFVISDSEDNISIEMKSKKSRVNPNKLIQAIQNVENVGFKLN
ncbi:MAG: DNA polymerase III subunit alpha [Bacteroidales bacterium]|nr:DNA polymerase III subunit alpha [Bacteroidales bacterium]